MLLEGEYWSDSSPSLVYLLLLAIKASLATVKEVLQVDLPLEAPVSVASQFSSLGGVVELQAAFYPSCCMQALDFF